MHFLRKPCQYAPRLDAGFLILADSAILHFLCTVGRLVALTSSSLISCGEIQDAARDCRLGKVNALFKGDTP
jgi:hypothetical protein